MAEITATEGVEARRQRGLEIAALAIIKRDSSGAYFVPSQFSPTPTQYRVELGDEPKCDCPDYETRRCRCKHIYAVEYIDKVPHFNSVLNVLENPAMFGVLVKLIELSALPLKAVESVFAVDSTGFAYSRFTRWYDIKYNRFTSEQQWVKAHIACGVKTNVVTAIEIKDKDAGDSPQLPALVNGTAQRFNVAEVCADKGYSGRPAHDAICAVGAMPFIAFKSNATGEVGGAYEKMFYYFRFKRDEFLAHYHQRSNVESTVMMIKTKFGDAVRSKTEIAAKNEVLCKVLCHNIACLISAIYELGIEPDLLIPQASTRTTEPQSAQRDG